MTLLDTGGPDQAQQPTPPQRGGRGRWIAGFGGRAFLVAILAALLGGLSGVALGSWIAWRDVDPMAPDRVTAIRLAPTVLPGAFDDRVDYYGRHTFWNPYSKNTLHGGTGVRVGRAHVTGTAPAQAGPEEVAAAVAEQMRAGGWQDVHSTIQTSPLATVEVTGTRGGYLAAAQFTQADEFNPATLGYDLMWAEPTSHLRDTVTGGLAGALLGLLLGLFTSRRWRRHSRGMQRAYVGLCSVTLLMLAPACLGNIPTEAGSLMANTQRNGPGPSVYWGGFVIYGAEPLAILSVLPILAIVIGCLLPPIGTGRRDSETARPS
ncbi:hypothetical protein GCM10010112_92660 [Actinoplanes lobatus]|uniref:Membrane protein YqaA with SNARE-associated domain n=2 Tax=Actinoplanes lobatus TaxID=113568 RepID=A0A7W7HNX0_9ACTN|nr:hypothetical protein [Actinoplanes lobatus]MBB4754013.1 membrane protein YqaA with SNARE-associated domain [Actinoplanes lobatus]GGN99139.1 hypothetical protein GCM10010112_92660 [Actinoplanes lobatus]